MPIVDVEAAGRAGWSVVDLAAAYLDGGATLLQLRSKRSSSASCLDLATAIVGRARTHDAAVVVNDRADIAKLANADGVHVGQDDLAPADVRRIVGDEAIVGVSTHTPAQIDAALEQPVTYVAIGPVFGTRTKATGYEPIGLDAVRDAAHRARKAGVPLVAIGGITLDRAASVIAAGAACVAVITDLLERGHPERRTSEFLNATRGR